MCSRASIPNARNPAHLPDYSLFGSSGYTENLNLVIPVAAGRIIQIGM